MVLVGVGAVMAVVAWVIVLLSPASDHPLGVRHLDTAASGPLTTLAGAQNAVPAAAQAAGHSIVELQATTTHGTVAARRRGRGRGGARRHDRRPPGRLCGTSSWSAPGASSRARLGVATDKTSDVALVNVPEDLPVAPFAADTGLDSGGTPDLALSFVPAGGTPSRCTARPAR